MSFKITTKLGTHSIVVEGKDQKEAMELCGFLAELPDYCPVCAKGVRGGQGEQVPVSFFYRETQEGHEYYGLRCKALGNDAHESSFGRLKKGGFWYKGEWKKIGDYNKGRDEEPPPRSRGANNQGRRTNQPGSEFED